MGAVMDIQPFLERCDRYCERKGMSRARLSTIIIGSGMGLSRLHDGKDITTRVLERATQRLAELERALPPDDSRPDQHAAA
jgi:hypothetical protein